MRGPARPSEWQPVPVRVSVGPPPPRTDDRRREQQEPSEAGEADNDAENCVYCREGRPHPAVPDETPAPTAPAAPAPRKRLPVQSVSSSVAHGSHESASESAHETHQRAPRAPAATEHKREVAAAGSTHSHIFVFDRTGKMVQGSPNVLQMYAPEAHRIEHILSPHTRTWIRDLAIFSSGEASAMGRQLADVRLRRAKGSGPRAKHHITGTLTVSPLKNEKGERLLLCELVSTGSPPTVPPVAPPSRLPRSLPKPSASAEDSESHKKQRKRQRKRAKSKSARSDATSYVPTARRRGSRRT